MPRNIVLNIKISFGRELRGEGLEHQNSIFAPLLFAPCSVKLE